MQSSSCVCSCPLTALILAPDVPTRYGDSVLIQKATDWALAQAQQVFALQPLASNGRVLALLGDLLHELQSAIGDETRRRSSDTLFASQILAILNVSR